MAIKKKQTIGYRYFMTFHMGICRGEVDSILEIKAGERTAWKGLLKDSVEFPINQPELFGGDKSEGGIDGVAELMLGRKDQTVSDKIKGWLGGIVPNFRGCTTLIYDGLVCSMSAYPKAWKVKAHRSLKGWQNDDVWYPEKCRIPIEITLSSGEPDYIVGMNPAHILYQVCTDSIWGRGIPRELMDDEAWRYAADVLFKEDFALCLAWRRSDNLDTFAQTVIDHIGATIYVDKRTGKMRLKLIRDDYDATTLPLFDKDSGLLAITNMTVSSGADVVNEVIVTYHDPVTNQDASVREQNIASIQSSNANNSVTTSYLGCPVPSLAKRLAKRDLRYSTTPLKIFSLVADRRAWHIQPGDVIKIKDDTRDQGEIVVRVGQVKDGTLTDGKIEIDAIEDVFIMPVSGTTIEQPSQYVPPDKTPKPTKSFAYEVPYANLNRLFEKPDFAMIGFNSGYYGMAAERNVAMSTGYTLLQQPVGGEWEDNGGNGGYNAVGQLQSSVSYMTGVLTIENTSLSDEIDPPCAIYVGEEIMMVTDATGVGSTVVRLTVERGIYDTIPARHDKGTDVWFYEDDIGADWVERNGADIIVGKCAPYTLSAPAIDPNTLENKVVYMDWRYSRPYPPGKVYTNNSQRWFNLAELTKVEPVLEVTWTHRDRVAQEDRMISHDNGNIGPETGSRYVVLVHDQDGKEIRRESSIDGTSWKYLWAQAIKDLNVDIKNAGDEYPIKIYLWTTRDDLGSWQYYEIPVVVKDVLFYLEAAQAASQTANQDDAQSVDGVASTNAAQTSANSSDYGSADGVAATTYAMAVNQLAPVDETVDYQAMEAPYITQLSDGFAEMHSRVMTFAARPTDRISDSHEVWSNKMKAVTKHDSNGKPYTYAEEDGQWQGGGSYKWTPWAVSSDKLGHLDTNVPYGKTSADDGVDPTINVGDMIMIDKELMRVDKIESGKLVVGRGAADTIPTRHYPDQVIWLLQRDHGIDSNYYDDEQLVGVKVRPVTYSPVAMPLDKLKTSVIQMAYRYKRPYAPGLMMIDGHHWFDVVSGTDDNGDPKNLLLTWRHRNRLSQGVNLVDHWHDDIAPEPNTKYQVRVGYTIPSQTSSTDPQTVILHEDYVDGTEWTYKKEWVQPDGLKAGTDLKQSSVTQVWITVFAIRDGVRSWHGYTMLVNLPSYAPAPGEKPNVPNGNENSGGGDANQNTGGTTNNGNNNSNNGNDSPNVDPNKTPNPNFDPNDGSGADPENPQPDKGHNEDGNDTKPTEDVKGSWSYNYDHTWARNLPDGV